MGTLSIPVADSGQAISMNSTKLIKSGHGNDSGPNSPLP
jgi:hypothetical protein